MAYRDYKIEFEWKAGDTWRKQKALSLGQTATGAIRRWKRGVSRCVPVRNIKAKRLSTYRGRKAK